MKKETGIAAALRAARKYIVALDIADIKATDNLIARMSWAIADPSTGDRVQAATDARADLACRLDQTAEVDGLIEDLSSALKAARTPAKKKPAAKKAKKAAKKAKPDPKPEDDGDGYRVRVGQDRSGDSRYIVDPRHSAGWDFGATANLDSAMVFRTVAAAQTASTTWRQTHAKPADSDHWHVETEAIPV